MVKKIICFYFILLQLLFFNSCKKAPSEAPEITTIITGKVTDAQTNMPLAGVQVTTNPVTSSVITGQDGNYTISNVNPAIYTITALKDGYNPNTITVNVKEGQTVNADIQLIKTGPELNVSPNILDFGTDLTSLTFTITNKTKIDIVTYQISSNQNWITISPIEGTCATESDIITVTVSRENLDYGNYSAIITINSDYGTKQISVIMTKKNPNSPQISLVPISLDFGNSINNKIITVKNTGAGTLNWNCSTSNNWIIISQNSGTINAGSSSDVTVSINKTGLEPKTYEGTIYFYSNGGNEVVFVKMIVEPTIISPPTLQVVGNPTKSSITLGWTASTDANFSNYKVYRSFSAGVNENSTLVTTINSATQTNFTDNGLNSNTKYYYKVYEYNKSGIGVGSNEVSATTQKATGSWVSAGTISELFDVAPQALKALADDNVWIANGNSIWHYDGTSWQKYFVAPESYCDFVSLFFLNSNLGWAISLDGTIYKYNGNTWTKFSSYNFGPYDTKSLVASSANDVWVSAYDKFYRFNGSSWSSYSVDAWGIYAMSIVSANEIYAFANYGTIYKWNGYGWTKLGATGRNNSNNYQQIYALSSDNIWFTNNNYLYNFDGNNFDLITNDILCFDIVDNNNIWCSSRSFNKLYYFNGTEWKSITIPLPIQSKVASIDMIDSNSGWAVGTYGEILRYK